MGTGKVLTAFFMNIYYTEKKNMDKVKRKYENMGIIIIGIGITFDCDSDTDSDTGSDIDDYKKERK